jgi:hypothetical protein
LTLQSLDAPRIQQLNLSSQEFAASKPQFELIQVSHVSNKLITKHALEIKSIKHTSKTIYNVLKRWQFHYHLGCKRLHAQIWKLGYCEVDSSKNPPFVTFAHFLLNNKVEAPCSFVPPK